jgi:hypothetical protein
MDNDDIIRTRFQKPYHYLIKGNKDVLNKLRAFFINFQLHICREELIRWQRLALANDQSAYDEAYMREDMMDFADALLKLVEAFWLVYELNKPRYRTKRMRLLYNKIYYLCEEEIKKPGKVVLRFCKLFRRSYAVIELMDLLDAVVTYTGVKKETHRNVVLFYQYLKWLVCLAYRLEKKQDKLLDTGMPFKGSKPINKH